MTPVIRPLTLNTDFTPQQENTLSVAAGVEEYFSKPIREAVKRSNDERVAFDNFLQETVKNANGRFQDQILAETIKIRDGLKDQSKSGWNSLEARSARNKAMAELTSLSSKLNYVDKFATAGLATMQKRDNFYFDQAAQRVNEILAGDIREIDINELDEIYNGDKFTNWEAKAGAALAESIGKSVGATNLITYSKDGAIVTGHWEFPNNFKLTGFDKVTGEPKFDDRFESDEAIESILTNISGGKKDKSTDIPVAYQWLDDLYKQTNPDNYWLTYNDAAKHKEALHNVFRGIYKNGTMGMSLPRPKFVDDKIQGKPSDPYGLAMLRANLAQQTNPENRDYSNKVNTADSAYQRMILGDVSILNQLLSSSNKVKGGLPINWVPTPDGNVFYDKTDPKKKAMEISTIKLSLGKEANQYFDANGNLVDKEAFLQRFAPFTGYYFKESARSNIPAQYHSFPVDNFTHGQDNLQIRNAASALISYFWDKGDLPLQSSSSTTTPPGQGQQRNAPPSNRGQR